MWTFEAILDALASHQDLHSLSLNIYGSTLPNYGAEQQHSPLDLPFGLTKLRHLRTLSLRMVASRMRANLPAIRQLVQGPGTEVTSLALIIDPEYPFLIRLSLSEVFQEAPSIGLDKLSLQHVEIGADPCTIQHFRNITTLKLYNSHFLEDAESHTLWDTLSSEKVHLRTLHISACAVCPVIGYIASYSGLIELTITEPLADSDLQLGSQEELARSLAGPKTFFDVALPMHNRTLEKLSITSSWDARWCFSTANGAAFAACANLRSLEVMFPYGTDSAGSVDTVCFYNSSLIDLTVCF